MMVVNMLMTSDDSDDDLRVGWSMEFPRCQKEKFREVEGKCKLWITSIKLPNGSDDDGGEGSDDDGDGGGDTYQQLWLRIYAHGVAKRQGT